MQKANHKIRLVQIFLYLAYNFLITVVIGCEYVISSAPVRDGRITHCVFIEILSSVTKYIHDCISDFYCNSICLCLVTCDHDMRFFKNSNIQTHTLLGLLFPLAPLIAIKTLPITYFSYHDFASF